jgi:hypothetical protein
MGDVAVLLSGIVVLLITSGIFGTAYPAAVSCIGWLIRSLNRMSASRSVEG